VNHSDRRHSPSSRLGPAAGLGLALALVLAACSSAGATSGPTAASAAPTSPPPSIAASAGPTSGASADQTDTDWGRIWDSLPSGFPTYPGSTPAGDSAPGPASATFAVGGNAAADIATWMQTQLPSYKTEGLSGPLEDGSYVLDLTGATPDCRVQVLAAPLGSLTTVTIMYGAACPHD
jgi:hypothetical protein